MAITREIRISDNEHVTFDEWFCHKTLENLEENPHITLGAVDIRTGKGYQLIGEVEGINMGPMMDGFRSFIPSIRTRGTQFRMGNPQRASGTYM